jgi:hypothetical protein
MEPARDRDRSAPSPALDALFGPLERWGWVFEAPRPYEPSELRSHPPAPRQGERYADAYAAWRERIERHEADALSRSWTEPRWSARRPPEPYTLGAVFGGTATGWHALVTTLGASLLGSGAHLTVVNLSERAVAPSLKVLARRCRYHVRIDTVAPAKCSFDLLSYIGPEQLVDFVVDVLRHDDPAAAEAREDRALLRAVASALHRRVTAERLAAALRVVLRESAPPSPGETLAADEHQRLSGLFGEQRRQHTDVIARAARLEHELADFVALERSGRHAPPEAAAGVEDLRIVEAARTPDRLDFDFSVRLLIEATLRRLSALPGGAGEVVLVAGADRFSRRTLQTLSDLAEQGGPRLVLLFGHLRDEALDMLGSGHAAVAFMRLTDHREAAQASSFIGTEHKFVVSQATRTRSTSYEQSRGRGTGDERSHSSGIGPDFGRTLGESRGHSESRNTGTSRGESVSASETDQRVLEPIAEPHVLQGLPETGVLLVDLRTRQPVFADCDPTILASGFA